MTRLEAWPLEGIGEVRPGDDLGALLVERAGADGPGLADGDVVLVTSKVVAKAEGRVRAGEREEAIREQTVRVVARRGATAIVENHLGMVMAAAGVDASNVAPGLVVLLPEDPDATARALREQVYAETTRNVAVVVTDTAGRAWRTGQTDLAVGAAGLEPLDDHAGRTDPYGNPLAVTAPAVVDELASVAELVTGKLGGRPLAVVRGLGERVLPPGEHGPGARVLVRPRGEDMFALGAREAVVAAILGQDPDCFGHPAPAGAVLAAMRSCGLEAATVDDSVSVGLPRTPADRAVAAERARLLAHAHGWRVAPPRAASGAADSLTVSPAAP